MFDDALDPLPIYLPTTVLLHYAPELACLTALDASLAAAMIGLSCQHPSIDQLEADFPRHLAPPTCVLARLLVDQSLTTRRMLRMYRTAVCDALRDETHSSPLPF